MKSRANFRNTMQRLLVMSTTPSMTTAEKKKTDLGDIWGTEQKYTIEYISRRGLFDQYSYNWKSLKERLVL